MPGRPEADLKGGSGGAEPPQGRRSDADDGGDGDADAPTPNPPQLGPQAHPVQEKISRSGEPLTLIKGHRDFFSTPNPPIPHPTPPIPQNRGIIY